MEKAPEIERDPSEKLSNVEKFKVVLGLFGTEQARDNFLGTCKEYLTARLEQVGFGSDAENYRHSRKIVYSPPRRAHLHNTIMETITRIATESKNLTPLQESVLRYFYSRENVAQAIKEYVLDESGKDLDDDDEEVGKKRNDMSGPAYFHSLGKDY